MVDFPLPADAFDTQAIDAETRAINAAVVKTLDQAPDQWSFPPHEIRRRRREGLGPFPLAPQSTRAQTLEIDGPHGAVPLRVIKPLGAVRGAYLHIHGGGWVLGSAGEQDPMLERIADRSGLVVVSVDYGLAPERPYPVAPDECEAAALWLARNARENFGAEMLAIGGESAGAHLSVVTLLRLRDRHGGMPFARANLVCGCFDLRLTPSARRWGTEKLVLNTRDIETFVMHFLSGGGTPEDADVSPLLADLSGLPPALFTIGTRDPLLDDSLFMAQRWAAAGNRAELAVYPGGAHVFTAYPGRLAQSALSRIDAFLSAA